MRTKNAERIDAQEGAYLAWVKLQPCGVCEAGGGHSALSEAHHINQGQHFTTIPLCDDCHRGAFNGIHGQGRIWKVKKLDEMTVLNETIRRYHEQASRRMPC